MASITKQSDESKSQCVRGMIRPNGVGAVQGASNRLFELLFACVAVPGEYLFGLSNGNGSHIDTGLLSGQQNNSAHFSEGNARLGVFVEGEDIFDDHKGRLFI